MFYWPRSKEYHERCNEVADFVLCLGLTAVLVLGVVWVIL